MRGFAHDQTRPSDSCYEATNEVSLKSIHIYLRYRTETSVTDRRTDGQGLTDGLTDKVSEHYAVAGGIVNQNISYLYYI